MPLAARRAPLFFGICSALVVWFVWGAINPIPLIQDEYSYVLQSRIFASGHWTAPSPPIPEFFQQAHVLTTPSVASKFVPGTALVMSAGALFGAPVLIPLLLTGFTAALLFILVRRVTNAWTGVFAVLVWMSDPIMLRFHAGYFSETVSGAAWLVAWWALLEWREKRHAKWMLVLAAAIGWGAITRPLTMLAFAIPVGVVVVRDTARLHRWRHFAAGVALGCAVLGIIPLWSRMTTGDWGLTPQTLYTRRYLPFDKPGFGVDRTRPAEALEPPQEQVYREFFGEHLVHTPSHLPIAAAQRLYSIARDEWLNVRIVLLPVFVLGVASLLAPIGFSLVCFASLFLAYLSYAHAAQWTLYYSEALPVIAAITALGAYRLRRPRAIATALALLVPIGAFSARSTHAKAAEFDVAFRNALERLPVHRAVVFVHYDSTLRIHANVVGNAPDLPNEPIWIVHDLGERDRDLMRVAGDRTPIAFYENGGRFDLDRSLLPTPVR